MDFFQVPSASDKTYLLLRDSTWEPAIRAREFLLTLWERAGPFLDTDLPAKAAQCLHPHYWELLVANACLAAEFQLVPRAERQSQDHGPDLESRSPRLWLEATAPIGGDGPDAVPLPVPGGVSYVPSDRIKMRLAGALRAKLDQYAAYHESGIISGSEPYVVALSGGRVPMARFEGVLPYAVATVFPFGNAYVNLNRETLEVAGGGYSYQPEVTKQSGRPVLTNAFLQPEFAPISALLYNTSDACNFPTGPLNQCLTVIHNPLATNPIQRGVLPGWREYWFDMEAQLLHWDDRAGPVS